MIADRKGVAASELNFVRTRTGSVSTNYLYNFLLVYRGVYWHFGVRRREHFSDT